LLYAHEIDTKEFADNACCGKSRFRGGGYRLRRDAQEKNGGE
jgi:hypothetical protein